MVKNILISTVIFLFNQNLLAYELSSYTNLYKTKNGTVLESLENIEGNKWVIRSNAKHSLFQLEQEAYFEYSEGEILLIEGYRYMSILGGLRKDNQSYKLDKINNIVEYNFNRNRGKVKGIKNFYDNLTMQLQIKIDISKKEDSKLKYDYFDKGRLKLKEFIQPKNQTSGSLSKSIIQLREKRDDTRIFEIWLDKNINLKTIKVIQSGPGFKLNWILDDKKAMPLEE